MGSIKYSQFLLVFKSRKIYAALSLLFLCLAESCSHEALSNSGQKKIYTASGSNIILISLDTLRADSFGYAGNQLAYTPNIDALAREGIYFTQAISTNSLTTPAHCSLFTGRYPTAHGVHTNGIYALPPSERTLAEFLKEHGYYTAGFASAFPVSHRFGLAQGFDLYNDQISIPLQEQKAKFPMAARAQRSATDVADAVISWVEESLPTDKAFFLFIHFFDAHAPYTPPPDFIERFGTSKKQRYAGEIAYIDSQLGRIFSALDKAGVRDKTIFIVTSDHGESLGEHEEETHGIFIYDSTIRIPLIFAGSPILQGKSFHEQVGIIDIFPTIVDLLDYTIPESMHGRSLKSILLGTVSHQDDIPYYIESFYPYESFGWSPLIGLRKSSEKLIRAPRSELYDLKHDPLETENLYQQRPDHVRELEEEFISFRNSIIESSDHAPAKLSREELSVLHSLGYTGAGVITAHLSDDRADPKDRIHVFRRMEAVRAKINRSKDVDSSIAELRSLEKEDPANKTLRFRIGQALTACDRSHEAESYYLSLISEYPDFTLALNELSYLLLKRQAWEEAATCYRKSLEVNPIQIELYQNLVYALAQLNLLQEAISIMERALELFPEETTFQAIRGELAFQEQDYDTAAKYFSAIYTKKPNDLSAAQNYARALLMTSRASQAIPILHPFKSTARDDVEFLLLYGLCIAQAGRLKEGIQYFKMVLAIEDKPSAYYFLGLCYLKMGKINEAERHFHKLAKDDPNYESSRRALEMYKSR